ncbi:hypothetical protein [Treponema sp.]|uniref:hypothetical protein n=1 Tax=Treponema sp. TaxID=166 RepID=UPI00298DD2C4|nr:hypothetical protein [Treponema sp.]MCR5613600.1 hypothetical protein [Treponema sp.]
MNKKKIFLVLSLLTLSLSFLSAAKPVLKNENLLVEYINVSGGVFIYYVDGKGQKTAVVDTVDYANSTFIGVAVDKKYYNLKSSGGVSYSCNEGENSLTISYNINKKIVLDVTYSANSKERNVLTIKYTIRNVDDAAHTVSLKSIFDTVFGDWRGGHYATAVKSNINKECIISDLKRHRYLACSDGITKLSFKLDGDAARSVYKVVVAAKPFFETLSFDGNFVEGRGFNTILSYNNSCVGFFFKSEKLAAGDEKTFTQKLVLTRDEIFDSRPPASEADLAQEYRISEEGRYVTSDDDEEDIEEVEEVKEAAVPVTPAPVKKTVKKEQPKVEEIAEESEDSQTEVITPAETAVTDIPTETIRKQESSRVIDKEYARKLIERINALDDTGKNTTQSELLLLQAELNEVLKMLKE